MAISGTDQVYEETIGGRSCRLLLRNGEIERFEAQHAAKNVGGVEYQGVGIFDLFDQLRGIGPRPQYRHVQDLIALGLVGGGMTSKAADDFVQSLPPSEAFVIRNAAYMLIVRTFVPEVMDAASKKRGAGSRKAKATRPANDTTPATASEISAE